MDRSPMPERSSQRLLEDQKEFRRIYMASYLFFLLAAIIARFLPRSWRPFPPSPNLRRSVFGDARAAANATIPFAFMG